jgi:glutathione S-transferase
MRTLYTFTVSHFSEKARWALDHERITYREKPLLPGAHIPIVRRRARRTSVPVLQDAETVVQGSSAILDYIEQRLGGTRLAAADDKRARELETLADRAFGLGTQRIFYATLLDRRREIVDLWTQGGPWWGRALYAVTLPLVGKKVRELYDIHPDAIAEAKDAFYRAFDETDRALAGNARYLAGDRFSRADIAVASLLAPSCMPKQHVVRWPETRPPELDAFLADLRGRPTWEFVLRMYREHRR